MNESRQRPRQEPPRQALRQPRHRARRRGWSRRPASLWLVLGLLVGGCGDGGNDRSEEGLTAGKFVEVVVALREAERAVASEDSAARLFAERKTEILQREGVTEAELRTFTAARDAAELEQLWGAISSRLRYVPDERGDPFPGPPRGDLRDSSQDRPADDLDEDPGARPGPDSPRRGPPALPPPPIRPDTGERRLH